VLLDVREHNMYLVHGLNAKAQQRSKAARYPTCTPSHFFWGLSGSESTPKADAKRMQVHSFPAQNRSQQLS